jgi:hypothetical protein
LFPRALGGRVFQTVSEAKRKDGGFCALQIGKASQLARDNGSLRKMGAVKAAIEA